MSDDLKKAMGKQLARLRAARGLTQEQVAERAGTNKVQVSQWENGERGVSTKHLPGLAEALSVPIEALFGLDETVRGRRAVALYLRRIADEMERGLTSRGVAPDVDTGLGRGEGGATGTDPGPPNGDGPE